MNLICFYSSDFINLILFLLTRDEFFLQPIDKQSFLDSGILCCLIHVLIALLAPGGDSHLKKTNENEDLLAVNENNDAEIRPVRQLEVPFILMRILLHSILRSTFLCYVQLCCISLDVAGVVLDMAMNHHITSFLLIKTTFHYTETK